MYTKLKTKPFKGPVVNAPTFKDIDDAVNECYRTCFFSTFPYIHDNDISSRTALNKYTSGNCIAMSMYIQKQLRKKNIISYLIPATVPNKYKVEGYLAISHVALAIPVNDTKVYLIDPAFYFLKPILITLDNASRTYYGMSKNVYKKETESHPTKYESIDYLSLKPFKTTSSIRLNEYQYIPKNTFYVKCHAVKDPKDPWIYYLRKVVNPDQAITRFFIHIKKDPFICKTILDEHGIVKANGFMIDYGDKLSVAFSDDPGRIFYEKKQITYDEKKIISDMFDERVDMSKIF